MNDAGYTLVETLAALMIVAMVIGGLTAGMHALGQRQQRVGVAVVDTQALRRAQAALDRSFDAHGAYGAHQPERFTGDADSFAFDCGAAALCEAELSLGGEGARLRLTGADSGAKTYPLHAPGPARFVYEGMRTSGPAWPPGGAQREALRTITVVGVTGAVLLKTRLWLEQPAVCDFDAILQDCR